MSLVDNIADHLKVHGPTSAEDLRATLGIASAARFEAAVMIGVVERRFERVPGPVAILRELFDKRPLPLGSRRGKFAFTGSRYGADRDH